MSNYINETLLGSEPLQKQQVKAKSLVAKWNRTGLLEGIDGEYEQSSMAQLLENQALELIREAGSSTSPSVGSVGADFKGDEEWSGVALPLVRRIFGSIAAQDFVSVQPMNLPSGLVFYLDFNYGTARQGRSTTESVFGKTGKYSPSGSTAPYGEDGLYGAGKYGYSHSTGSINVVVSTVGVASLKDINYDMDVSASNLIKCTAVMSASSNSRRVDKLAARAFNITSGSATLAASGSILTFSHATAGSSGKVLSQFTKVTGGEGDVGNLTFIVSSSGTIPVISATDGTGYYKVEFPTSNIEASRGDFEDTAGDATADSLKIPEINLNLKSRPIVAKTRKLKAIWTPELAQDLNAYHSVDAEAELTSMLSEYISMEIDLEILDMLIADASTVDYWSLKQGDDYDATTGTFKNTTFTGTRFEWWQTLVSKVQKTSNEIHRLTLRGGANFIVCSPKISTILESLPGYNTNVGADATVQKYSMGVSKIGAVDGRYSVYKNPYMQENTILVGYRGSSFLETGAVYAPYVPLIMTPLVYDPSDFTPRKGVMTRYAKKMIRPEFYAKIYVSDLNLL